MLSGKLLRSAGSRRWGLPQLALVAGPSMGPLLPEGAWILVRAQGAAGPRLGQVVVAEHPSRPGLELVKRVAAVSSERQLLWLAGDNRDASTDSDDFGPVPWRLLRGVVLLRVRPLPWLWLRPDPSRLT
ncbi:MAG TPA: nickel-type superoxide dismutase maturation protease [Candidatus Dormibacteraeota bacterium]